MEKPRLSTKNQTEKIGRELEERGMERGGEDGKAEKRRGTAGRGDGDSAGAIWQQRRRAIGFLLLPASPPFCLGFCSGHWELISYAFSRWEPLSDAFFLWELLQV